MKRTKPSRNSASMLVLAAAGMVVALSPTAALGQTDFQSPGDPFGSSNTGANNEVVAARGGGALRSERGTKARTSRLLSGPADSIRAGVVTGVISSPAIMAFTPVANGPDGPLGHGGYYSAADISGQRLTVPSGGGRTFWNFQISNWGANDPTIRVRVWQGQSDAMGLLGAMADCGGGAGSCVGAGNLTKATQPCVSPLDCQASFNDGIGPCTGGICDFAWINSARSDRIFSNAFGGAQQDCSVTNPDGPLCFAAANAASDARMDEGVTYYGATVAYDVPVDAKGLYTIGLVAPDVKSFLQDDSLLPQTILLAVVLAGEIEIPTGSCCTKLGLPTADCLDTQTQSECEVSANAPFLWSQGEVCLAGLQSCPLGVCIGQSGACDAANGTPGCTDMFCCTKVCAIDASCCSVEWDATCAAQAAVSCADCNGNGIDDPADILLGTSLDCDGPTWPANGIPDECDIAACAGDPACDDCNLNGIPDGCEATAVCGSFVPSPVCATDDWSCPQNWAGDVPAGSFPDDVTSAAGISVTLGSTVSVLLDVPVVVPAVILESGSALRITGPAGADLDFSSTAALNIEGDFQIDGDHTVGAQTPHPAVTIGADGHYGKAPAATSVSAALTASSVALGGAPCDVPPCPAGGVLELTDTMSMDVVGDVTIDGTGHGDCHPVLQGSVATFHAPPTKWVHDSARVRIGGSLLLLGSASLGVSSLATVTVSGDFENRSESSSCFDCTTGTLIFDGSQQQLFEVADTDVGQLPDILTAGYVVDEVVLMSNALGGATVRFVDESDNDGNGQLSGCSEALYVRSLVLGPNTTVILDQANVYFEQLTVDATAQILIEPGGCANLIAMAPPPAPMDAGELAKDRALAFVIPTDTAGQQTALRVTLDSLYHPGTPLPIDLPDFSAREGEIRYVNLLRDGNGNPVTSCLSSAAFSTFYPCATVGCVPEYADWAGIFGGQTLYVSGTPIIPDSSYRVAQLAAFCAGNETICTAVSGELALATARYGDADDNGATNVIDIVQTVDVVKDVFGATWEYQCYLRKELPRPHFDSVNVTDIVLHVDAVKLLAYPLGVPACP